jgi:glucoamylase
MATPPPDLLPEAPGRPGIPGRWTSSAKSGVGTATSPLSRVWFTLSHGIVNEVYYPRVDMACIRDLGLIVTAEAGYAAEEKRAAHSVPKPLRPGVPAWHVANTSHDGRWRIEKRILTDPQRDTLLQEVKFEPLSGALGDYRLHVLLAPHLVNRGAANTGWIDHYKGHEMLFARGAGNALALAADAPWLVRSSGFVGVSDGWADLMDDGRLSHAFARAQDGNVALIGEIDLAACGGRFLLALGFGRLPHEAAWRAVASIQDGIEAAVETYIDGWEEWQDGLMPLDPPDAKSAGNLYRISTAVLKTHNAHSFPGGYIASLSIPWGFNKGDEDLGGYHLVWPRDLVETAGGFLAAGAADEARQVLLYLQSTQEPDGSWPQNMWLDGTAYWHGVQMDEAALPILLADLIRRKGNPLPGDDDRFWPMIERAIRFILREGPVTGQDRWEEDGGFAPFTLAVEIAALLAAADVARRRGLAEAAQFLEEVADSWNDDIERWTYVSGGALAQRAGVAGYYVRIGASDAADGIAPTAGMVAIRNRPAEFGAAVASDLVSPDALALVRFGLRSADDPRILDTVTVIDSLLKADLPQGPVWYRYNEDGYGEQADGAPFDGTGIGRPWPLLTAERAHYALAAGDTDTARALLSTLEASAGDGGMLPEQVWDGDDIPARELFRGRPSGSAMPLVWAHAEHLKLLRSLADGEVFDMPPHPVQRYQRDRRAPLVALWTKRVRRRSLPAGRKLRIAVPESARIRWSVDGWVTWRDDATRDSGLGTHYVDLESVGLPEGSAIDFTLYYPDRDSWEGIDYRVAIE